MEKNVVVIEANNTAYSAGSVRRTMTVGELIQELYEFDLMSPVVLKFDNGYTYGPIEKNSLSEEEISG